MRRGSGDYGKWRARTLALILLALCAIPGIAAPVRAEPGVTVEIRVKEFLQANPPVSAWVDSNTVRLPVGVEVYGLQGNFGVNLLVSDLDSHTVNLQYRLATLGTTVRHRSGVVNVELGVPVVIDSIPGKGKSYYRALLTPRAAEVDRSCLQTVGDPASWPSDPSAYFDLYYVKNSLADAHWNGLRDFLEKEYKTVHQEFSFEYPGKVHFYFCPCRVENLDFEPGFGFALDPSRLAGYALYHRGANSVDPQITNLLKFYRWWGFAPRFLAWGVSGYTDFADFYAKQYLKDGKLVPLKSLLISADFRSADPLVAYFESASFVRFLIELIGVNAFKDLYFKSTDLSIKPAFLAVTGKTIDQWDRMWRKELALREFRYPELIYHAHRAQAIRRETEHLELLELAAADLKDSISIKLTYELAVTYYSLGQYGNAYTWYKKLVSDVPDDAQFRQYCGNMAVVLGRLDEAWGYFEKAIELDTAFSAPFLSMGEIIEFRGRPDSAAALWQTGLGRGESIPLYIELLVNLARRDRRLYRPDSAQVKLTMARNATARLLKQYPDHPRYLLRMADILTGMKKTDSALIYYEAAEFFEDRPFYLSRIHLGRGKAYDLAGHRKRAVEYYERVFEVPAGYLTRKLAERYINEIYR